MRFNNLWSKIYRTFLNEDLNHCINQHQFHYHGFTFKTTWRCVQNSDDDNMKGIHNVLWSFMMLRFLELLETVFFVLRKKKNQITFLHVYHQVSSIAIFWIFFKFNGGMMEIFFVVISELAHIIKFLYYLLSSYTNITTLFKLVKFIKPITIILQMIELILILMHSLVALNPHCQLSSLFYLQILNIFALIVMYVQFFIECYMKRHQIRY